MGAERAPGAVEMDLEAETRAEAEGAAAAVPPAEKWAALDLAAVMG